MRTIHNAGQIAVLLAALLPSAAYAADCKLQMLDKIKMTRAGGGQRELVPVMLNGTVKNFVLDTAGYYTQIGRKAVDDLKLPVRQGTHQMYDVTGNISRDETQVHDVIIGHMRGADRIFPVNNGLGVDGLFAIDFLYGQMDMDVDFSNDTLNLFAPNHCPGQVAYWTSPTNVGSVPITMNGFHITVPVTLDGKVEQATIDTGSPDSTLTIPEAQRLFGLTPGGADTPEAGKLNGDDTLKVYTHKFQTLAFGDVTVNNPSLTLIPNAMGRNAERTALVYSRAQSEKTVMNSREDDMLIGMDVLTKLHVFFAFGEKRLYFSLNPPVATPAATN